MSYKFRIQTYKERKKKKNRFRLQKMRISEIKIPVIAATALVPKRI